MTTLLELAKLNGRQGSIEEKGLTFFVRSMDVRKAYGKVQVLVQPIAGKGQRWVDAASFTVTASNGKGMESL